MIIRVGLVFMVDFSGVHHFLWIEILKELSFAMFLKATDCKGKEKEGQFTANILIEAIELAGQKMLSKSGQLKCL